MENNYNLKIKTTQVVESEAFDMDFEINASYVKINDIRYISYIQIDEESKNKLRTTIKIKPDGVVTIIKGKSEGMILEIGKTHSCNYPTPFGNILLEVSAFKIANGLNDDGGELELQYSLIVDGNELSKNTLNLTVKEI
ncbi:MAG: DUF1934 domain-containing protein [Candidatus Pseudoruminococcus sp.]|uniref:DUF1934 domain-containing protein n=1 Tax=Candidatus Pseudoruminococcus sp. TaxID=3101048 RepID=UPI002A77104F|nr:DUF1934 domain-containing protein [Ruminococcus sp.]MDY2783800.1 DUF1934 domain-containing protein [Candidatus Pseudoruminococcus sp.]